MAKRKKTPDILSDLLGSKKKPKETKPKDSSQDKPARGESAKTPDTQAQKPIKKKMAKPVTSSDTKPAKKPVPKPALTAEKSVPTYAGLGGTELDAPTHFVGFIMGSHRYALPLENVESALQMVALTPLPETPPWVAGAVNIHGRVISVLDLRERMGGKAKRPTPDDYLLVVRGIERSIALIVDEVTEVMEIPASQVEPPSGPLARSRPLAAVVRQKEDLIMVLDAARLVPSESEVAVK